VTLALDTDVLVNWLIRGSPFHRRARRLVENEVRRRSGSIGLVPQVLHEFLHVATDPKRFERPLSMPQAIALARELWDAQEVVRIIPQPTVMHRTLELLSTLSLGRKRILDTVLAATLEASGVTRLATFNGGDFRIFPFLEIVEPT
jgi:predicted nucleic acid-binding protein